MGDFRTICIYENLLISAYFFKRREDFPCVWRNPTFLNTIPRAKHVFNTSKLWTWYARWYLFRCTHFVCSCYLAYHSCCLSHHVFNQVNLWPDWVGCETAIFWHCSPGTVETQRLYPLHQGPRRAIKDGFFCLINPIICSPYLVFHSRVRTEFVIVFNWNHFEMRLLNLKINFLFIADILSSSW